MLPQDSKPTVGIRYTCRNWLMIYPIQVTQIVKFVQRPMTPLTATWRISHRNRPQSVAEGRWLTFATIPFEAKSLNPAVMSMCHIAKPSVRSYSITVASHCLHGRPEVGVSLQARLMYIFGSIHRLRSRWRMFFHRFPSLQPCGSYVFPSILNFAFGFECRSRLWCFFVFIGKAIKTLKLVCFARHPGVKVWHVQQVPFGGEPLHNGFTHYINTSHFKW